MAARKSSRANRKYKMKYRVTTGRSTSVASGAVATSPFGFPRRRAKRTPPKNCRRGGQPRYSNLAIVTALTLRMVFHLPLARGYESQKQEARIGCNVLNRMAELGEPESQAIVGE